TPARTGIGPGRGGVDVREGRGRLVLATAAVVAMAASALVVAGVAAAAGGSATRDVLVTSVGEAEGTLRDNAVGPLTLTVVSRGCAYPGAVAYTVKPLTTDDRDLIYKGGVITFDAGDMKDQTLTVDVRADDVVEPDEQFVIALVDLRGAVRACDIMAT